MTWTAESISVVPGSIVIDVDREESVLYVHALGVHNDDDIEKVRGEILGTERRLAYAVGSHEDVERVRMGREARADVQNVSDDNGGTEA
jgi:multicomponent Na+:H+ antiporter subunit E